MGNSRLSRPCRFRLPDSGSGRRRTRGEYPWWMIMASIDYHDLSCTVKNGFMYTHIHMDITYCDHTFYITQYDQMCWCWTRICSNSLCTQCSESFRLDVLCFYINVPCRHAKSNHTVWVAWTVGGWDSLCTALKSSQRQREGLCSESLWVLPLWLSLAGLLG